MRYAVVGTGVRGVAHARVATDLRADGPIDEVVVCGADERRARELGECFSAPVRTDVSELSVDAATVAAPASVRCDLGERLLAAGTDLLVEPPIAESAADAAALVETAADAGRVLAVGGRIRHHPALRALRRRVEGGDLGEIRYLQTNRFAATGGGDRRSLLVPDLDVHAFLLDASRLREGTVTVDGDGTVAGVLQYEDATGVVNASRRPSTSGPTRHAIVVGDERSAYVDLLETDVLELYETADGAPVGDPASLSLEGTDPTRAEVVDFLQAVETGAAPTAPGRVGVEVLELFETVVDAPADRGRPDGPEELTYGR